LSGGGQNTAHRVGVNWSDAAPDAGFIHRKEQHFLFQNQNTPTELPT